MRDRGVFISWVQSHGRSRDLAQTLGLREFNYPPRIVTLPRPARYLCAAFERSWKLARTRPAVVMVMSPPPFPVQIGASYGLTTLSSLGDDVNIGAFNRPAWR